jgi:hypothetical protein
MIIMCDLIHINAKGKDGVKDNHLQYHLTNTERWLKRNVLLKMHKKNPKEART